MQASDPMIPFYALGLSVITFGLGYIAGRVHRLWLRNPRNVHYGPIVRRAR